ncbi:hypothetical protein C8R34_1823 [Nitrosomonas sp. Nm84]|nr:hypothetical protein C8R34_1823 [Nitrosomonas sp. Nm84]
MLLSGKDYAVFFKIFGKLATGRSWRIPSGPTDRNPVYNKAGYETAADFHFTKTRNIACQTGGVHISWNFLQKFLL